MLLGCLTVLKTLKTKCMNKYRLLKQAMKIRLDLKEERRVTGVASYLFMVASWRYLASSYLSARRSADSRRLFLLIEK